MALNARSLLMLCWTSGGWAFSFGLGSQVVTHWLKEAQASDTAVGLSHSFYYLGLAVASAAVPWMTRRLGHTRCAVYGLVLSGVTLAAFPWGIGLAGWYLLRFFNGWAGAMCLVPLETIVSRDSEARKKTQNFACFGVSLTLGGALGIAIGSYLCEPGSTRPFFLGGCVPIAGALIFWAGFKHARRTDLHERATSLAWRDNFLSYGTAWCQGFLEGGMLAFLALFLLSRGFERSEAGMLMGASMIGVIVFQVPVSWLADRFGKTLMLLSCYAVVALTLATIHWVSGMMALALVLFAFGACTGAMYPLGLSILGERMPESGLARAYAWYLAIECFGSQFGAAAMGWARDEWGESAMFAMGLAAVLGVLGGWLALRRRAADANAPTLNTPPIERQAA